MLLVHPTVMVAQSTHGTLLGTVKDPGGSVVPDSEITIKSIEEGASRVVRSDAEGNYRVLDVKPGHYRLEARKAGFKAQVLEGVQLQAHQELRVDFQLNVGTVAETVEVNGTYTGAINSETPAIGASHSTVEVLQLPANYRASGSSTSPLTLVQSLPGVQPDSDGKYSVQGGLPFMSETSVDGITTQDTTSNNPLRNAWPSAESIGELRVDGVGNNAEFGQPGEITTVSKSGTNSYHGALFWYHQNRALDATPYGAGEDGKPQKIGNDYGFTVGGPVRIPGLYNGHDRTFFYGTYEGFQFPKGDIIHDTVPTQAMRNGDFSNAGIENLNNPFTGGSYGNQIPTDEISSAATKLMTLFPLPNVGDVNLFDGTSNYTENVDNSYYSKQFDIRGDQYLGSKMQIFGRFSWKNIHQNQPTNLVLPTSDFIDQYRMLVVSGTYNFKPNLLNEFRFGFTRNHTGNTNPFDGPGFAKDLGLNNIGDNNLFFNGVTQISFESSISNIGVDRLSSVSQSNTFQYTDTATWTKGRHNMKFGFDVRHLESITPLGFSGADNYGSFDFTSTFTGYDFADFLLGLPTNTFYDTVQQDNRGISTHYNFYGQDTWQVTPRFTLSYGLRYEYHPGYHDSSGNIGNFDPSVPKSGRVIYPDGHASLLNPGFLANFNACPNLTDPGPVINGAPCTQVLSASQAHLPQSLRTAEKLRLMPRIGVAFRPFNNNKSVIRAGFGMYNITTLGAIFFALTGTLQSGTQVFGNQQTETGPLYQWPLISGGGSGFGEPDYNADYFGTANDIHFKDPLSSQWNVSFDHELPHGIGARVSYIGMKTTHLVWAPSYNDMSYSTTTAAIDRPQSDRPFPNWVAVNNRASSATATYNSLQMEVNRRFHNGLSFNSAYTLARSMADNQAHQQSFADENGGSRATYFFDRHLDYGRVYGTRRHRWISTAIYTLPIGRGHALGNNWGKFLNGAVGGWRLSNIFLWQSGPYLTPFFDSGDPSGTGSGDDRLASRSQYPDQVGNPVPAHQSADQWINPAAFVCPGDPDWQPGGVTSCNIGTGGSSLAPIGRFGNSRPGAVVGPGTVNLSTGLIKEFALTEHVNLTFNASFTNVLNHTNLSDPEMNIDSGDFGRITSSRDADFGGNRTGQVSLRLEF
ncbi:MAG: TonB-dependent receptor [Acidobacteria bacterium]|nr:TonB-dependent receptor [Acidobacteriota bacterium]